MRKLNLREYEHIIKSTQVELHSMCLGISKLLSFFLIYHGQRRNQGLAELPLFLTKEKDGL
jgi:hypothetical protein